MAEPTVRYENPAPGIARIVLARADKHNAINPQMIFDTDQAFNRALRDDSVKVIILAADGRNFSAGHDIADTVENYAADMQERSPPASAAGAASRKTRHMAGTLPRRKAISNPPGAGATSPSRRSARCRASASPARWCSPGSAT
jgi:enoyl-CoA hydratase/carnithine racemase